MQLSFWSLFNFQSFDCAGSIPAKALIIFSLWPIIIHKYYLLFLYLYSSEVDNNDFCAFSFLFNQTITKLCISWLYSA